MSRPRRQMGPAIPPDPEGPTSDPRLAAAQQALREQGERQRRKDIVELLSLPAFRRYMGEMVGAWQTRRVWRGNAEINVFAARHDLGVEIFEEFSDVDTSAYLLLRHEQLKRVAQERETLLALVEQSNSKPQETSDAE